MMNFSIIVAMDANRGIGKDGGLIRHLPQDMAHFKQITTDASEGKSNAVIMGRKTWDSIPDRFRPLPDRMNVVLSRDPDFDVPEGCMKCNSLDEAFQSVEKRSDAGQVFIIGGASIYEQAIGRPSCRKLYVTQITEACDCDVFFPKIPDSFKQVSQSPEFFDNGLHFSFIEYQKIS